MQFVAFPKSGVRSLLVLHMLGIVDLLEFVGALPPQIFDCGGNQITPTMSVGRRLCNRLHNFSNNFYGSNITSYSAPHNSVYFLTRCSGLVRCDRDQNVNLDLAIMKNFFSFLLR